MFIEEVAQRIEPQRRNCRFHFVFQIQMFRLCTPFSPWLWKFSTSELYEDFPLRIIPSLSKAASSVSSAAGARPYLCSNTVVADFDSRLLDSAPFKVSGKILSWNAGWQFRKIIVWPSICWAKMTSSNWFLANILFALNTMLFLEGAAYQDSVTLLSHLRGAFKRRLVWLLSLLGM